MGLRVDLWWSRHRLLVVHRVGRRSYPAWRRAGQDDPPSETRSRDSTYVGALLPCVPCGSALGSFVPVTYRILVSTLLCHTWVFLYSFHDAVPTIKCCGSCGEPHAHTQAPQVAGSARHRHKFCSCHGSALAGVADHCCLPDFFRERI